MKREKQRPSRVDENELFGNGMFHSNVIGFVCKAMSEYECRAVVGHGMNPGVKYAR